MSLPIDYHDYDLLRDGAKGLHTLLNSILASLKWELSLSLRNEKLKHRQGEQVIQAHTAQEEVETGYERKQMNFSIQALSHTCEKSCYLARK